MNIENTIIKFAPVIYVGLRQIQSEIGCSSFENTLDSVFSNFESISVDYGIMEQARNIYLVKGNFGWNDLGSWESVYQISEKDKNENAESGSGEALYIDSNNAYVHTNEGLVKLIGLEDVIVVMDGNAVVVCNREKSEDVKKAVEQMKSDNKNQ